MACHNVFKQRAVSAFHPYLQTDVRLVASIVFQSIKAAEILPVALARGIACTEYSGYRFRRTTGHCLFVAPHHVNKPETLRHGEICPIALVGACGYVAHLTIYLFKIASLTTEQLAVIPLKFIYNTTAPRCVIKTHVAVQKEKIGRRAIIYTIISRCSDAHSHLIFEIDNGTRLETLPIWKAIRRAVVYCDYVHLIACSFTHAFNSHDDFLPFVEKGNDDG